MTLKEQVSKTVKFQPFLKSLKSFLVLFGEKFELLLRILQLNHRFISLNLFSCRIPSNPVKEVVMEDCHWLDRILFVFADPPLTVVVTVLMGEK